MHLLDYQTSCLLCVRHVCCIVLAHVCKVGQDIAQCVKLFVAWCVDCVYVCLGMFRLTSSIRQCMQVQLSPRAASARLPAQCVCVFECMHVCMCACMHICVCMFGHRCYMTVCGYVRIYIYICMCVATRLLHDCVCSCVRMYMGVCMHACTCASVVVFFCMCVFYVKMVVCMHVCFMCVCMYAYMCAYVLYVCMYACVCARARVQVCLYAFTACWVDVVCAKCTNGRVVCMCACMYALI
jgi:hypothetical protein